MFEWSRMSKTRREKQAMHAAPPPNPSAFTVPGPRGRTGPYVAANFTYADNPQSPNYDEATGGREEWRTRTDITGHIGEAMPSGTYPAAGHPPEDWNGYYTEDWQSSQRNEIVVNADEGLPLIGERYHPALNPYWYKIPNSRVQRTPHEYDFTRPFDQQNKLGRRNLTGVHYSAANIGMTANPSESLKGMTSQKRRRTTHRIEPIEYGENMTMSSSGSGPTSGYPVGGSFGPSYAL